MAIAKKAISRAQSAVQATPEGYEVKRIAFQQWQVIKDGEVVAVCQEKSYAVNRAWRHSDGSPI